MVHLRRCQVRDGNPLESLVLGIEERCIARHQEVKLRYMETSATEKQKTRHKQENLPEGKAQDSVPASASH